MKDQMAFLNFHKQVQQTSSKCASEEIVDKGVISLSTFTPVLHGRRHYFQNIQIYI
jgi:predicted N-formylglutamate amidohydrolase